MFGVVTIILLCVSTSAQIPELDAEWENFKISYNKAYQDTENRRREIWEANVDFINEHNHRAAEGVHSYLVHMNEFGDMEHVEFIETMTGLKVNRMTSTADVKVDTLHLPSEVDWTAKGYVSPVSNQGQCGSCWAFAALGSLEGQHFKSTRKLVTLSAQNLIDCSQAEGNYGCNGGLMDNAYRYIEKNHGVDTNITYPYVGQNGQCHFKPSGVGATQRGFVDLPKGNEGALQKAVAEIGPIAVGIDADSPGFQFYKSGVYVSNQCNPQNLCHAGVVTGYGALDGVDYWRFKNSWGTSWGINGYMLTARNNNNQCGIATQASYALV